MSETAVAQAAGTLEREGIKETLESIVIALILAFVFRAFIVEAFVIPTGSMAPTLYGAHGTIVCEDCGVEFAYGVKDLADNRAIRKILGTSKAVCPNCNHPNTNLKISDDRRNREKGDRILVLKWPFDIGGHRLQPARWDVTVFKDPADGTTNFIKRMIGLPNEVLMLVDGDVYTVPTEDLSDETLAELEEIRHEKYEYRTKIRKDGKLRLVSRNVLDELDEKMTIERKTPEAQESLWFRVYDHDYPPQTLDLKQPRWEPGSRVDSGWDTSRRTMTFEDQGVSSDYIELRGKRIEATCAYNVHATRAPAVSDVRVRFVLTPRSNDGAVRIRLHKLNKVFWATIQMNGMVTLAESIDVPEALAPVMATKQLSPFVPGKAVQIAFENLDYRLTITVGDEQAVASSDDPDSPAYYAPELKSLRQHDFDSPVPPRVYGDGGTFELAHVVVERDGYYFHDSKYRALAPRWAPEMGWASSQTPILLREREYFMLGDNTSASKDSRLWDEVGKHLKACGEAFQLGTVPRDQLIGKAFFVYWPSGHRLEWLPIPGLNRLGIVPDVGRMRWIR